MIHKIPVLKRLLPSIGKRWARIFWPGGYAVVSSNDALFLVNYRNFVDRRIAFHGGYETEQMTYLTGAMRARGCDLFLDIGANIGLYSVQIGREDLARRILAFEPDPRNAYQFGANLLMNGLIDRIEVVAKAVSNRSGPVNFQYFPDTATGQSRVDDGGAAESVDAVRIDDQIQLRNEIVFAKIDVEGHEIAVIEGIAKTIRSNKVFLQVESFPEQREKLSEMLKAQSFRHLHSIGDDQYFANF